MNITGLAKRLPQYEEQEARSIVRLLLFDVFGLTLTDICGGALDNLNTEEQSLLEQLMRQLEEGAPVQYVTGKALFADRTFHVRPGVLIPRPETEELCRMVERNCPSQATILDIGTGSGCIAITLALEMPETKVSAWDISDAALGIAQGNAKTLEADVCFEKQDALSPPSDSRRWDVIVSNPPYIKPQERDGMAENVLNHEPEVALFAPEENPIIFYQRIGDYAWKSLTSGGLLFYELNPLTANEVSTYLSRLGFEEIEIRQDLFGKQRMLKAKKR